MGEKLEALCQINKPELLAEMLKETMKNGFKTGSYEVIHILAALRGYWKVSYKFIADAIPKAVNLDLVSCLPDLLEDALHDAVFEESADLGKIFEEDPLVASRRANLKQKKEVLTKCSDILQEQMLMTAETRKEHQKRQRAENERKKEEQMRKAEEAKKIQLAAEEKRKMEEAAKQKAEEAERARQEALRREEQRQKLQKEEK